MNNIRKVQTTRAASLDALRGYAILSMVLSGTVAFGILPGWMYHAQVPPPVHKFEPSVFGITWVDLVFPFFLFAMGAALPFSTGKKLTEPNGRFKAALNALIRGAQLTFFAIFIQHMYPWVLSKPQDMSAWLLTLFAFALMFPMFMRFPEKWKWPVRYAIKLGAYAVAVTLLLTVEYADNRKFSVGYSNIIILVLANMAVFGSLAYIFTSKSKIARVAILPFIMAVFLGSSNQGSWVQWLFNYTPAPWFYKFYYLKYLFIVIPGTIAGEYLLEWTQKSSKQLFKDGKRTGVMLLLLSLTIIITSVSLLYARMLVLNLAVTSALLLGGYFILKKAQGNFMILWRKLFFAGAYLMLLGLFFEAYEGGIRKDQSTYSYYFVSSGLAFMALIFFSVVCDLFGLLKWCSFLVMNGQNPMIAYVASAMLVMPLLSIAGVAEFLSFLNGNPWLGFFKGVLITTLVTLVTMFFTRLKWFWRT